MAERSKWPMVKLGKMCENTSTITPIDNNLYKYIDISSVSNESFSIECPQEILGKNAPSRARRHIKRGDVLFATVRPTLRRVTIVTEKYHNEVCSTGYCVLRTKQDLHNKYLFYYLLTDNFFLKMQNLQKGASYPAVTDRDIKNQWIPLPPIEVQREIAKVLDAAAELTELHKKRLTELDILIQSVFYDMFGDPVTNEKGWREKSIAECCLINPKKSELKTIEESTLVSFVPMTSVSDKGEIDTSCIKKYREVKKGFTYFYEKDVLFAKITPCMENGKGAIARFLKNKIGFGSTEFHILRPKLGISTSEWVYYFTTLEWFRALAQKRMTGSAGQRRVPEKFFYDYKVPLPPLALQQKFASIIEKIEAEKALARKGIEESQYLFDSLMARYFGTENNAAFAENIPIHASLSNSNDGVIQHLKQLGVNVHINRHEDVMYHATPEMLKNIFTPTFITAVITGIASAATYDIIKNLLFPKLKRALDLATQKDSPKFIVSDNHIRLYFDRVIKGYDVAFQEADKTLNAFIAQDTDAKTFGIKEVRFELKKDRYVISEVVYNNNTRRLMDE